MSFTLCDDAARNHLFPFTHTRSIADIRCGIFTMRERWERLLAQTDSGTLTEAYLQPLCPTGNERDLLIHGGVFGTPDLAGAALALKPGERLISDGLTVAARLNDALPAFSDWESIASEMPGQPYSGVVKRLQRPWDVFSFNEQALREDFKLLTS